MNDVLFTFTVDVTVIDFIINIFILCFGIITVIALIISKICDKIREKKWEHEVDDYWEDIDNE